MRLTSEDFQRLLEPPAVTLQAIDHMVVWIEAEGTPPFTAMVLRLKHPDLAEPFDQLIRMVPSRAARLSQSLADHSQPPET